MHPLERFRSEFDLTYETLGTMLGVDKSQASRWCNGQRAIGAKRAVAIEAAIGVPRAELRPDLFGPPKEATRPIIPSPRCGRRSKPVASEVRPDLYDPPEPLAGPAPSRPAPPAPAPAPRRQRAPKPEAAA